MITLAVCDNGVMSRTVPTTTVLPVESGGVVVSVARLRGLAVFGGPISIAIMETAALVLVIVLLSLVSSSALNMTKEVPSLPIAMARSPGSYKRVLVEGVVTSATTPTINGLRCSGIALIAENAMVLRVRATGQDVVYGRQHAGGISRVVTNFPIKRALRDGLRSIPTVIGRSI